MSRRLIVEELVDGGGGNEGIAKVSRARDGGGGGRGGPIFNLLCVWTVGTDGSVEIARGPSSISDDILKPNISETIRNASK